MHTVEGLGPLQETNVSYRETKVVQTLLLEANSKYLLFADVRGATFVSGNLNYTLEDNISIQLAEILEDDESGLSVLPGIIIRNNLFNGGGTQIINYAKTKQNKGATIGLYCTSFSNLLVSVHSHLFCVKL